ncbi:MAG: serine/threonine protein kinase [Deltaproteobacteria bacterium]|nr:serine/threonine protein kinase [Deltaproteobacteria bacterium]
MNGGGALPIRPGTVIDDKFRVEAVLGEGGMGVVVRAMHLKLQAPVAIKFLLPEALADRVVVERFRREAQMSARLTSDNVARVLDVGNLANGAPYMVMEYLQGETLGELLGRRKHLAIHEACNYMMQVCEALTEAHALGFVHRDLKPGNLFLVTRPNNKTVVKLLDFGISKIGGMSAPASSGELTMTTMVLGTPSYMAPEQLISSRTVDSRADLWSCGVVLYRMLTGELPFDADSLIELGVKLMNNDPPDLRKLRPDVPAGVVAIVRKCLERDASDRYQTAQELSRALAPFAMESGTPREHRPPTGSAPTLLADSQEIAALAASGAAKAVSSGVPSSRRLDEAPPSSDEEARITLPKQPVATALITSGVPTSPSGGAATAASPPPAAKPVLVPPGPPPAPPTPPPPPPAPQFQPPNMGDTVPKALVPPKLASEAWPQDETRVASPAVLQAVRGAKTPASLHSAFSVPNPQQAGGSPPPPASLLKRSPWIGLVAVIGIAGVVIAFVFFVFVRPRMQPQGTTTTTSATTPPTPVPVEPPPPPPTAPTVLPVASPTSVTSVTSPPPSTKPSSAPNPASATTKPITRKPVPVVPRHVDVPPSPIDNR